MGCDDGLFFILVFENIPMKSKVLHLIGNFTIMYKKKNASVVATLVINTSAGQENRAQNIGDLECEHRRFNG